MTKQPHPSPESLWRQDSTEVRAHLATCPACQDEYTRIQRQQTEVQQVLASASDTSVPPAVADRLQAAIAAEASRRGAEVLPLRRTRRRPTTQQWLAAAAAVAVALLGVGVLAPRAGDNSPTLTDASTALEWAEDEQAQAGDDEAVTGQDDEAGAPPTPAALAGAVEEAVPPVPKDLLALADDLGLEPSTDSEDGTLMEYGTGCGQALVAASGGQVIGCRDMSDDPRGGVLVLVAEPDAQVLWWLPSFDSGPGDAMGRSPLS